MIFSYSLWLNISIFAKYGGSSVPEVSKKAFMSADLWGHLLKKKIRKLSDRICQPVPFFFFHGFWDVKVFVYCWYYTEVWSLLLKDVQNLVLLYGVFYFVKENQLHSKTHMLILGFCHYYAKYVVNEYSKLHYLEGKPPVLTTLF